MYRILPVNDNLLGELTLTVTGDDKPEDEAAGSAAVR